MRAHMLLLVGLVLCTHAPIIASDKPNIVLIMSDDMGFSDIGCYGGEIATPNLDKLASGGLRYTQFYNTARCCPTRASLLTGLYPHQAGVGWMMSDQRLPGYTGNLAPRCVTIGEVLRAAGYGTYMSGKWHVTRHTKPNGNKENWPLQRGFDRFYGTITGAGSFFDPTTLTRGNTQITPDNDTEYRRKPFYYTDAISDQAVRFVREHCEKSADRPFFLYVAHTAAHWPMHALPQDIAKYRGKYDRGYEAVREARLARLKEAGIVTGDTQRSPGRDRWPEQAERRAWEARCMEVYAAMVDRMDQGIGRLVAELERLGKLENTLIFFLQDNGGCAEGMGRRTDAKWRIPDREPLGKDELQPKIWPPMHARNGRPVLGGPDVMPGGPETYVAYGRGWATVSNTPFREYKHWVHEGGIATPLIVHWPETIAAKGELRREPTHLIDIMATCVDVAGASYPKKRRGHEVVPLAGLSLQPTFAGNPLADRTLFWEHEGNRAVRRGPWKLVAKGRAGAWELYDMRTDRTERLDLAKRQPDRARELASAWQAWARESYVLPWPWKRKGDVGSRAKAFSLSAGQSLPRNRAPRVGGRAFRVTAKASLGRGVLAAQGGVSHGWVVWIDDGIPVFAIRRGGDYSVVRGRRKLEGSFELTAELTRRNDLVLSSDGTELARKRIAGKLVQMPVDGLHVGRDAGGFVGRYGEKNDYTGKIERIRIDLFD